MQRHLIILTVLCAAACSVTPADIPIPDEDTCESCDSSSDFYEPNDSSLTASEITGFFLRIPLVSTLDRADIDWFTAPYLPQDALIANNVSLSARAADAGTRLCTYYDEDDSSLSPPERLSCRDGSERTEDAETGMLGCCSSEWAPIGESARQQIEVSGVYIGDAQVHNVLVRVDHTGDRLETLVYTLSFEDANATDD